MGKTKYEAGELSICPMATSLKSDDPYKHICKITKTEYPFYEDEGMSVCKSKTSCISHFGKKVKRKKSVDILLALKLLFSKV